jgi:Protein of unknown function (DUF1553)/Protein of unknown function (DUF1549)/Planctomycete cytochrome C
MQLFLRQRMLLLLGLSFLAVGRAEGSSEALPRDGRTGVDFFEKRVRPILAGHCYACHSADTKPAGGLRVDDRNGMILGGNKGPAVVPGKPEESLLLKRVTQEGKRRMPLEGEYLSAEEVADLTTWIKDGAAWPTIKLPVSFGKPKAKYEQLKREHWAFRPLTDPRPPGVRDSGWAVDDIDRFLLAKLEAKGLSPVGDSDRVTLIRRVTFDLTGLPPTPREIADFVQDVSPQAYPTLVDRLLASPAFGQRWGRHWLDVARYAESTGPSRNIPYPHAWRYRDYVIDSVNADVPFDQFIREQVAGDLLPAANDAERNRLLTATGFLALGPKDVNQRFKVRFLMDNVDEQIDVVSRSTLGLTVACARCHDHKFDPIPTSDYYALAGIFTSTDNAAGLRNQMGGAGLAYYVPDMLVRLKGNVPEADPKEVERLKSEVATARDAWEAIRGTPEGLKRAPNGFPTQRPYRLKYEKLQGALLALTDPAQHGLAVHGLRDAIVITDTEVRVRGEAEKLGPPIARGYLTAFEVPGAAPVNPKQSGRLELAHWLTNPANPLTPRVAVNRVWQHLFGSGIVSTVDNFGSTGDLPSHPELLDHLANRFVRDHWSLKRLVRSLVLTRAYRLSGDATPDSLAVDPANRLVWRHAPRRLAAEEFRDSVLASTGTLNNQRPADSVSQHFKMIEIRDNGPEGKTIHEAADKALIRSVYLPLLRGLTPHALEVFDPVEQTLVTGVREETTVPGQALFLLNSPFVRKQSLALAEQLLVDTQTTDEARVRSVYWRTLGREPKKAEVERALAFLDHYAAKYAQPSAADETASAASETKKKGPAEPPLDPDQIDQTGVPVVEEIVRPKDARTAAWLAFAQAVYASAEFRYVR